MGISNLLSLSLKAHSSWTALIDPYSSSFNQKHESQHNLAINNRKAAGSKITHLPPPLASLTLEAFSMIEDALTYWLITKRPISQWKGLSIIPRRN
jgi:hypothetical protein